MPPRAADTAFPTNVCVCVCVRVRGWRDKLLLARARLVNEKRYSARASARACPLAIYPSLAIFTGDVRRRDLGKASLDVSPAIEFGLLYKSVHLATRSEGQRPAMPAPAYTRLSGSRHSEMRYQERPSERNITVRRTIR